MKIRTGKWLTIGVVTLSVVTGCENSSTNANSDRRGEGRLEPSSNADSGNSLSAPDSPTGTGSTGVTGVSQATEILKVEASEETAQVFTKEEFLNTVVGGIVTLAADSSGRILEPRRHVVSFSIESGKRLKKYHFITRDIYGGTAEPCSNEKCESVVPVNVIDNPFYVHVNCLDGNQSGILRCERTKVQVYLYRGTKVRITDAENTNSEIGPEVFTMNSFVYSDLRVVKRTIIPQNRDGKISSKMKELLLVTGMDGEDQLEETPPLRNTIVEHTRLRRLTRHWISGKSRETVMVSMDGFQQGTPVDPSFIKNMIAWIDPVFSDYGFGKILTYRKDLSSDSSAITTESNGSVVVSWNVKTGSVYLEVSKLDPLFPKERLLIQLKSVSLKNESLEKMLPADSDAKGSLVIRKSGE